MKKILAFFIILVFSFPSEADKRVGVYQVATARADLVHNDGHKLERLAPPDVRNRTRINALVNNASTNFIYCVPEPDGGGAGVDGAAAQPLGDVIGEILGRVFHTGDGVVGMGGLGGIGVGFRAAGRTQFFGVTSGGDGADTQNLFTSEGISISNTYSNVHDIHPSQGIFTFYATSLYHTEPKALNELMRLMALPGAPQIRDAIIISRKPMCSCCSRLTEMMLIFLIF
jgi:hypothetical protein